MDEEYLKLFKQQQNQDENLNETKQNNPWENLNKPQQNNQWQKLNEIDKSAQQYNINENANDGWSNQDFVIEKRINGIPQTQNHPFHHSNRRNKSAEDPNGLNQFIDEDLREVVKTPNVQQGPTEILSPPPVQNIKDVDIVSIEMFENMNSNALLTLVNGKLARIDAKKVTNNADDRQVKFLGS